VSSSGEIRLSAVNWAVRNVRVLFVAYLVVIAVGLAYFITLGVLHQ
jgi:hypothetical protein